MDTIAAPMDAEQRMAAAGYLEDLLVDLITLSLNTKQAHWHVTGRNFLPVHEQLNTLEGDVRLWADDVAERSITLGVPVDGRPAVIGRMNALKELPPGFLTDVEAVTAIGHQVTAVADRIRTGLTPSVRPTPPARISSSGYSEASRSTCGCCRRRSPRRPPRRRTTARGGRSWS